MRPLVLLDCDGILGDFCSEAVAFANRYGRMAEERLFTLEDITRFDILESLKLEHLQDRLDRHMIDSDYCRHMPVYPGAQDFVERLRSVAEVVVVTSPYSLVPTWCHARVAWLGEHFGIPKRDIIFAKRKELVRGDWLIDDSADNVRVFQSHNGNALLLDRPWNRYDTEAPRVFSYEEILGRIGGAMVTA